MGSPRARSSARSPVGAAGFTLIEVVVAVAIVSMAVVATLAAYGAEFRALTRAAEVSKATMLADDRLTTITLLASEHLPILPDSLRRGQFQEPFSDYTWLADTRNLPGHDLIEVTVTVSWPSGSHEIATVVLPTGSRGAAR